jgi:DNA adenine methylase
MIKTKPLTPFLKWAGGKAWLAPKLAEMYDPFRNTHVWVEPFCGALGATLGVMPERAILSDVNPHLINLYRHIDQGISNSNHWQNTKEEFEDIKHRFNLYQFTDEFNAQAFYYLNRTCFNGLCRFNRKGGFNVGFGKYKNPKLNHDFSLYQEAFKSWDFFDSCYGDTLAAIKELIFDNHFIYADPPYDDGFTSYSGSFTWDDQVQLASTLAALNCPVVASNKATDRIVDLYQGLGFELQFINVRRRIACNGDRTSAKEILATRNI